MPKSKSAMASSREDSDFLSQDYAEARAKAVSNVAYKISIDLSGVIKEAEYSGSVTSSFAWKGSEALTVDFKHGKVKSVSSNGVAANFEYNGKFVTIPAAALRKGQNELTIEFTSPFSKTGDGLYKFVDPEDGAGYVYTNFEPYSANEFFPCFDQPDLKATYTLDTIVPETWQVISAQRETEIKKLGKGLKHWFFKTTERFSTYLFSLHAGPFHVWEDLKFRYPMRLFARKSLAKYVPADDWFRWSKAGMDFFDKYFGIPYPFFKYDQVICPDANMGAMENVASVTFNENFVKRGGMTYMEKQHLTNVILHEMAHMWFGNLVTMKWWDDLWLNESFATYMASLAMYEATEFKTSWQQFFLDDKVWAYTEDQWPTTHPIQPVVPDTAQAFANFDGITYGKGASLLKQVSFFITPDAFREGVKTYFQTFAYKNTVLTDFIEHLDAAAKKVAQRGSKPVSVKDWSANWLKKEGLNTLAPKLECDKEGNVKKLTILQDVASGKSVERSHRTRVGLYDLVGPKADQKLRLRKAFDVMVDGAKTQVSDIVGEDCPDLLYINTDDHAYAKIRFDEESLKTLKNVIGRVEDPHFRIMLWYSLWEEVRDGHFSVEDFCDLALKNLGFEKDITNATRIAGWVTGRRKTAPSALYYLPDGMKRKKMNERFEEFFMAALEGAEPGGDFQKLWLDGLTRISSMPKSNAFLERLLKETGVLEGYELDQDRRWNVVVRLSELEYAKADTLIEKERLRDKSDKGHKAALAAQVIRPKADVKKKWVGELLSVGKIKTVAEQRTVMSVLFPLGQNHLRKPFADTYYEMLPKLANERDPEFMRTFVPEMAPVFCESAENRKFSAFVDKMTKGPGAKKIPAFVQKPLKIALDENERCIRIRGK